MAVYSELNTKTILSSVSKMPVSDIEILVQEFNTLIAQKKAKDKKKRIAFLLKKHNETILGKEKRKRFFELQEELLEETISESERQEYLKLAYEEEELRNERVKYLIEIAQLKEITLPALMLQLGLNPPEHA